MEARDAVSRRDPLRMASDRTFGWVMGVFCAVLGLAPLLHRHPVRPLPLILCAAFVMAALVRASLLHPLNRLWTALARALHRLTTPLICGILFYLVVTPVGFLFRIFGNDPLQLRADAGKSTYWIERQPPGPPPESMRVQF